MPENCYRVVKRLLKHNESYVWPCLYWFFLVLMVLFLVVISG